MVPLRLHSDFSLLKAMVPVDRYCEALQARGYKGGAITDFDNGFGWVDFYFAMKKANLKAILGSTLKMSLVDQIKATKLQEFGSSRNAGNAAKGQGLLTLLALSNQGYRNLCLVLTAHSLGRLNPSRLLELQEGLVLMVSPDHPQLESGKDFLSQWNQKNLFFEVHRYEGAPSEDAAVRVSTDLGARCVATQPVYYLNQEDARAHEVMLSIGEGVSLLDEKRPQLPSNDFHLKTSDEFSGLFKDHPEWLEASDEILSRCDFEWKTDEYHIPKFTDVKSPEKFMVEQAHEGLNARLELVRQWAKPEDWDGLLKTYRDRLDEELEIIKKMRFTDYFLVVSDFIKWSKSNGVPVGPGRGSGAGSLVAYCLSITDIDPVRYNLLFERFLNPERISMPDFDVDFCIKGRDRVIDYVRKKYDLPEQEGSLPEERLKVSQIITFGKMKSKAVIRDVGRALGIPYGDVDAIAKLIPNVLNITLKEAFEKEPKFAELRERDPKADELLQIAESLEGMNRHASVHAAGVVIADDILTRYIPLYQGADGVVCSQFEMKGIEKLGLLKFDFLGLRNLTVIQDCIEVIGKPIDLLKINYSDPKVMSELSGGDTTGIFQLESSGMRDVIRRLKPTAFEDIIAIVALYRPGPLEGGMVDDFILRKQGRREVQYDAAVLEPLLKETYGVFVYQEQVMKTANVMAGYSLGEADLLRRAMGKKIASEMAKQRERFVDGATKLGHSADLAQKIFDLMSEFAKYGFNKSHAAAYAMITVQTAYLRTYYPEAFYAALLSSESEDQEKLGQIIRSANHFGIEVLPPHVNFSQTAFSLEDHQGKVAIRFGLSGVKNLGGNVADAIVRERESRGTFKSFQDFFDRAPHSIMNRRQAECLIRSGSLDQMGTTRSTLFASLDSLLNEASAAGKAKAGGQSMLFAAKPKIKTVEEWADRIRLNDEKHLLGAYMSGHPLRSYAALLQSFKTQAISKIKENPPRSRDTEISVAGLISSVKEIFTKKGTKMAFATIEDYEDQIEIVVFSDLYEDKGSLLVNDRLLLVKAQVSTEGEMVKLIARDVSDLAQVSFKELHIQLQQKSHIDRLQAFPEKLKAYPGPIKVKVHIPSDGQVEGVALRQSFVTLNTAFAVQTHPELMAWLASQFGDGALRLE
jgi:DNA polymerase-3 subunit alpha